MKTLNAFISIAFGFASLTASASPADKELMAAYERGMACYRNPACKPTISKTTLELLETMKCSLDAKCKAKVDPAQYAQISRLKDEFPPNETASSYYQRVFAPDRDPAYEAPAKKPAVEKSAGQKPRAQEEVSIDQKTTMDSQYGETDSP